MNKNVGGNIIRLLNTQKGRKILFLSGSHRKKKDILHLHIANV